MRIVTDLMDKVFSENTPSEFKDAISSKIDEARSNGQSELSYGDSVYSFAENDGGVLIEDKLTGEVTVAYSDGENETLEGVDMRSFSSATQFDAKVPGNQDGKKNILPEGSTEDDVDVTIEKTAGIVDKDKAGVGKNFSLCIHGFETEEEAQNFYSDLCEMAVEEPIKEGCLTFSDDELEQVAFSATEAQQTMERLQGTMDIDLAFSLAEQADALYSYATLAGNMGHDLDDVKEAAMIYSEAADEALNQIYSDMSINEFFSELDEEEVDAYFSGLDELTADVLYSALESGEDMTFSEVQELADEYFSDLYEQEQLSQSVTECFSECENEEIDAFFSELSPSEQDVVYSVLEEDEDATFSDLNEALAAISDPINEVFSDMTEEEFDEFCGNYSNYELDVLDSMLEDGNYLFSDFLDVVIENREFSKDDLFILAENCNQLQAAFSDLEATGDPELAKKVKVLADKTIDDCECAEAAGHDVEQPKKLAQNASEKAAEIADKNDVDPSKPAEGEQRAECDKSYSDYFSNAEGEQRVFAQGSQNKVSSTDSSINPCLTSAIN